MEEKIVEFIRQKYNPLAIILYGSRATDIAKEHSDWDIVCLVNNDSKSDSFEFEGESIDLDVQHYPLELASALEVFDGTLQSAKLLLDTNGVGEKFLSDIKTHYALGRNLSDEDINLRKQFLNRRLTKLIQSEDNSILFSMHIGVFIEKATQYWFEVLNNRWRTSLRSRLAVIEHEDLDFYKSLELLASKTDLRVKISEAKLLISKIF
jgi:hypothetical protein